jgi:hypothetical protein
MAKNEDLRGEYRPQEPSGVLPDGTRCNCTCVGRIARERDLAVMTAAFLFDQIPDDKMLDGKQDPSPQSVALIRTMIAARMDMEATGGPRDVPL